MLDKIIKLPKWCILGTLPAFYDTDSVTATEQTARVYAKMNELVDSYNAYVEQFNKHIEEYEGEHNQALSDFICQINCLCDKFINTVDMKIDHQNRMIDEVYQKFATDILNTTQTLLNELKEAGEIDNVILSTLDNTNVKIDNFIAEVNGKQAELEQDYQETKSQLEYDYNRKGHNLDTDYQNTKSALNNDYEETKGNLMDSVERYTDLAGKIGQVIYSGEIPTGSQQNVVIGDITQYSLVLVQLEDGSCIAPVSFYSGGFNIVGAGATVESTQGSMQFNIANITGSILADGSCVVVSNISTSGEDAEPCSVLGIKGII